MSSEPRTYLQEEDFAKGLRALDEDLGKDEFITAFAPIRVISAGGFLAVSFLQHRKATADIDYLLDPEWVSDDDIKGPLRQSILKVARDLDYHEDWVNEDMSLFVTSEARKYLFEKAEQQNIVLFGGENILILAAPIEWALERKMRRVYTTARGRKAEFDLSDCAVMLRYMRERENKPLNREFIRTLNVNTFDVTPDNETMDRIEAAYRERYKEEIFR